MGIPGASTSDIIGWNGDCCWQGGLIMRSGHGLRGKTNLYGLISVRCHERRLPVKLHGNWQGPLLKTINLGQLHGLDLSPSHDYQCGKSLFWLASFSRNCKPWNTNLITAKEELVLFQIKTQAVQDKAYIRVLSCYILDHAFVLKPLVEMVPS